MSATSKTPRGVGNDADLSQKPAFGEFTRAFSLDERLKAGRALRDSAPRTTHGAWKRSENSRDPIDILLALDADRIGKLIPIRYGRMLQSPFAFYRGSAGIMAADLSATANSGIYVQACGDCHLMNFGGFATPERNILFDINDFDETLPAPWEWDVKRLAASFVLAARSIGLPETAGRETAIACLRTYRKRLAKYSRMPPLDTWYARITADDIINISPPRDRARIERRLAKIAQQDGSEVDFPKITFFFQAEDGIRDRPPLIYHPE